MSRLALSTTSTLLRIDLDVLYEFCHLEFVKEAISDGFMAHSRVFWLGGDVYLFGPNLRWLWIDLDVLYGFDEEAISDGFMAHLF